MFASVLSFETKRMSRNFPALFFGLAFPVMLLGIFGGIYGNEPTDQWDGLGTVDFSVAGYVALVIAVAGLMSFPLGMVEYRSRGFLRRLRATPARPGQFLTAQVLTNGLISLLGIAALFAVAALFFDLKAPAHPVQFAGIVLLCAAAMFGVGMVIASLARTESSALVIANLVYFPMIFLTGATVPLELMPDAMRRISDALPLTYAVEALRWGWLDVGGDSLGLALGVLAGTVVVCAAISAWLFRWE